MTPQRLRIKLPATDPAAIDPSAFTPVFHRWIQQQATANLLIDVADYKHVHEGPAMMLVAHECDYTIDFAAGRPGLAYTRKRAMPEGGLAAVLKLALRDAVEAGRWLEDDAVLPGVAFTAERVEVTLLDRLRVANTAEDFERVRGEVEPVLEELLGAVTVSHAGAEDPRRPLALTVEAAQAPALGSLARSLGIEAGAGV